jgi:transposase InsO family protein
LDLIVRIQERHHYRYGRERVREELCRNHGKRVSLKKAARLMGENGLNARRRRKFIRTIDSRHTLPVCPNILSQQFHAKRGGEKWVSDITYLRTGGSWVYLTVGKKPF